MSKNEYVGKKKILKEWHQTELENLPMSSDQATRMYQTTNYPIYKY